MYNPRNLSVLAYANGFTLWHYRTDDNPSDVEHPSYFDKERNMLRPGDMLIVNAKDDAGRPVNFTMFVQEPSAVKEAVAAFCDGLIAGLSGEKLR